MKYLLPISLVFFLMLSFTACDIINPNDDAEENEEPEVSVEDFWEDLEFPGGLVSKIVIEGDDLYALGWNHGLWRYDLAGNDGWAYAAPVDYQLLLQDSNYQYISDFAVSGKTVTALLRHQMEGEIGEVWLSDDRGENWTELYNSEDEIVLHQILLLDNEAETIVAHGSKSLKSENSGDSWTDLNYGVQSGIPGSQPPIQRLLHTDDQYLIGGYSMNQSAHLLHLGDNGKEIIASKFESFNFPDPPKRNTNSVALINQNPLNMDIYIGFSDIVLRSVDQMNTWESFLSIEGEPFTRAIEFHPGYQNSAFLGTSDGVFVTHNDWQSTELIPADTTSMEYYVVFSLKYDEFREQLFVGTFDGLFLYTGDMIEP